jgi:uncharacterized repeat protein (TIGR01451 family)
VTRRLSTLSFAAVIAFVGLTSSAFAQSADLSVTKGSPSTATAGSDVSFDVTIANFGPDDAATVSLTDPLPAGMTFVSETQNNGPAFLCSAPSVGSGGTITCTIATLPSGSSANFTFTANIPPATPPGTTFSNTATASSATFDPNDENNSGSSAVTVPQQEADLSVSKIGPSSATAGSNVTYTISAANGGPDAAVAVVLRDVLPGTMTFVSITQNSGPAFDCTSQPAVGSGGTIDCTILSFASGGAATFTLIGQIPAGTASGTQFDNPVTITSKTDDQNPGNNTSDSILTVASSDLSVTKTGPATATAGGTIAWIVTVTNNGPDTDTAVTMNDDLPPGTTFASLSQNTGPSASCTAPSPGFNGSVTCTFATLGSGGSAQFTITATIDPTFTGILSNTATVFGSNADPNNGNNSATSTATVSTSADLTINKTGPATANAGTNITYTVTLTNAGPSVASTVSLTDAVPANTTFVSASQSSGVPFSCTTPPVGGTGTVSCSIATFPIGSAVFSITVHIGPGATGATITNTAVVTSTTPDPNPAGNNPTATTTVTGSADVSIVKTAAAGAIAGTNLTYNITVTNNGPSDASVVTMTDTLPANTTFVSENQPTGPAFTCINPPAGGTGTVNCSIATLTAGTSATFAIVVQVANAAPAGPSTNTANVTSTTPDTNPGNNSSSAVTQFGSALADLSLTKTPSAGPYGTGMPITYTLVVANAGPSTAQGGFVNDLLPGGTTYVSSTPPGACTGTTAIHCTFGTLAVGATTTFTITVTLPAIPGSVTNSALVSGTTPDPGPGNDLAVSTVTVIPAGNIPMVSPLSLLLLCVTLAFAGVFVQKQ